MNKITKTLLTLLIFTLIVGAAFYPKLKPLLNEKKEGEKAETKGKEKKGGPSSVEIIVVKADVLEEKIQSTGTLIPNEEVDVRSEISGRITQINFKEGDFAVQGQTLIKINDADLQAQLQKINYQKQLATVNEDRQNKLLQKEAISQSEYDISLTNLNSINADIENLKAQLAKTIIRAPFSGKTGLRYVSSGSYITPSSRITSLTSRIPIKLDFGIPAKYSSVVSKGTKIDFMVEGDEKTHYGNVYAIESKIDPNTRTMLLRAISPNPSGLLTPGAFAKVEIVLNARKNAILIPTEAVIPDLKGHKVFIVKNNKAESIAVEIGSRSDKTVEIISGLSVGDSLVTSGILQIKNGGEVKVVPK